jgi:hypothetical protein
MVATLPDQIVANGLLPSRGIKEPVINDRAGCAIRDPQRRVLDFPKLYLGSKTLRQGVHELISRKDKTDATVGIGVLLPNTRPRPAAAKHLVWVMGYVTSCTEKPHTIAFILD